ncbi:MAG TPA: NADH:ubiquinone reductase (Na(+)-transporting) subunit C [Cryomorphaceae bacterium]|nr:NADH:ubiquinone reductase (Na(+)-transporting) subunit C [Cryomorphaceae bacterium]
MALNKNSNAYTFIFAIVMVVIVGVALAFTSVSLKPLQEKNAVQKKMLSILASVGVEAERETSAELFEQYFAKRIAVNHEGEVIRESEGPIDPKDMEDPFNVDVQKEFRSTEMKPEDRSYPLYLAEIDGERISVIPLAGKGLWGPIWGYIALREDDNTIYGASFDHAGETPGLGAEISEQNFGDQFKGKTLYDESGNLVSITLEKTGASPDAPHAVDGITGGTITSKGVEEMIRRTMGVYSAYFEKENTELSSTQ